MSGDPGWLPEVGPWAKDKLDRLRKYLSAYTTIMANQAWADGFVFVDAFAGAGRALVRQASAAQTGAAPGEDAFDLWSAEATDEDATTSSELSPVLDGSPAVALGVTPPFTRYVFLERDAARAHRLAALQMEFAERDIVIHQGDSNEYLCNGLVRAFPWRRWRAVVFVDPFGMQVPWATFERLAHTKAIEVFVNVPVSMAIQRLLKRSGQFSVKERTKLDGYFGDPGWYDLLYRETQTLFGAEIQKVTRSGNTLVTWYRERLQTLFGYASAAYLVSSTRNRPLYYLVHAGPNATGAKIATSVLTAGTKISPSAAPSRSKRRR